VGGFSIQHRKLCLVSTMPILLLGGLLANVLKPQFFPKDLQYLSYVDVWLPEDSSIAATTLAEEAAEAAILKATDEYSRKENFGKPVLRRLTSFVGGGAPRFWFSAPPEPPQLNYSQIIVEVTDKHLTAKIASVLQDAMSASVPGARVDLRQLETGKPVGIPVSVRISGDDVRGLRLQADRLKKILRSIPTAERVRDDWGEDALAVRLKVDADRANVAGVTNQDVADSTAGSIDGQQVGVLREGDREIPIIAIARAEERSVLGDISNAYVYSRRDMRRVPLRQVASLETYLAPPVVRRYNQYRAITVSAFPAEGYLPSDVLKVALPRIQEVARTLPPGYRLEIAGEDKEQKKGFQQLSVVMAVSVVAIFLALVIQFKHAVKPLIVFAAIPYGAVGALVALWLMNEPFGFMAFLGVASLMGVIVSHIIVLFDYIEERHDEGVPLKEALLDAGILRLRPVLITVGATVIALFPLALHGGPLWEPLCYAQIGGLIAATAITLLLVPVLYSVFVLDLKWVKWEVRGPHYEAKPEPVETIAR
jgi:multidrug efflux pump subunit AcrB